MSRSFASSSVGTKVLIAVTGLLLFAFLVLHLAGNLLFFLGPETFNAYSHALISNPLVIPMEIGLLAVFLLHIYQTGRMYLANRHARPEGYEVRKWAGHTSRKSVASTTMIITGLLTALFVVIHLWQFKFGAWYTVADTDVRDLYRLMIEVFTNPVWVVLYVAFMVLLLLHLRHGFSSAFQSLGASDNLGRRMLQAGLVVALVIGGGFAVIPIIIYFAW
jgi:succinate dehydrogenase / fumarate reductase, cytochrome b subunit